jgi:hypothetical protein
LREIYSRLKIFSKDVRIKYLKNLKGIEDCDLVFICESEQERIPEILDRLKARPVLTISDCSDGARKGVMVNFMIDERRVRFEINLGAVKSSGLNPSSHLLKVAKAIY